jgi:hypothetical protein
MAVPARWREIMEPGAARSREAEPIAMSAVPNGR